MTHHGASNAARLMLVRHGRCVDGTAGLIARSDSALEQEGRRDLLTLAHTWTGSPPSELISSDLARARQSAEVLGRHWGIPVSADARIAEVRFGRWEGLSWDDVARTEAAAHRRWSRNWQICGPPEGESLPELCARVSGWMEPMLERAAAGSTIVTVTHAGVIRALLMLLLDIPATVAFRFSIGHACVTTLLAGRHRGKRWCEVAHVNSPRFQQ